MKIKDLVNYWDKHARGRLTRDAYFMALSDQHHKRLEKLAALYPMKSPQDLMRDLISAALDEMETSFPYVQGTKVVAYDEDGASVSDSRSTPAQHAVVETLPLVAAQVCLLTVCAGPLAHA